MVSAQQGQSSRSRTGHAYKLPLMLFMGWVIFEYLPSFVPSSFSDEQYSVIYFLSEDFSTVLLTLACYFSLSYTSIILKGVSLSTVVIASSIMIFNAMIEFVPLSISQSFGLSFIATFIAIQCFMTRFIIRMDTGEYGLPNSGEIYLIVSKPHGFMGLLGLIWSGIGGGFSIYIDGDCYWFPRDKGELVKTHDPDWYKGKRMISCGPKTPEKMAELNDMIGQKWSIFNNCFTVIASWSRKWSNARNQ